jgi:hypothetical protein
MYFQQTKLTKSEWEYCEVPVSLEEKKILQLIQDGYYNINIKYNDNQTLIQQMKIEPTTEIDSYLYIKYFKGAVEEMTGASAKLPEMANFIGTNFAKIKPPKKTDIIRLTNLDLNIEIQKKNIFEFVLLDFCEDIYRGKNNNNNNKNRTLTVTKPGGKNTATKSAMRSVSFNLYNLIQLKKSHMPHINSWVAKFVGLVIEEHTNDKEKMDELLRDVFHHSPEYIEKNPCILKYENKTLYDHQKQLFSLFSSGASGASGASSKLVFYTAPTGTGKTLSPLGLSNQYKIIYICASRHIGLAFAKNAISIEKKVAFAFGCESAGDIRLHYFAAKDYEKNRKTGGIYRVDNSNGEKVEIMICDVASYTIAMYYMLSFNAEKDCIMYWDEPTISLDYAPTTPPHPLHSTIHDLWKNNSISNVILSCATLPNHAELMDVIEDFSMKFNSAEIHTISSYECKKTISLINKEKYTVLPHVFFEKYTDILECVLNCKNNKAILRYFDLKEIVAFVEFVVAVDSSPPPVMDWLYVANYFHSVEDITMNNIKLYYLDFISSIHPERWEYIYSTMKSRQTKYWTEAEEDTHTFRKIKSLDERAGNTTGSMTGSTTGSTGTNIIRMSSLPDPPTTPKRQGTASGTPPPLPPNTEGILLTTVDAHTLTDGVSIFFAEDVEKIGRFMIHQSKIPEKVLSQITEKITSNQRNQTQIESIMKTIDDKIGKDCEKDRKMEKNNYSPEIKKWVQMAETLKGEIKSISLDPPYIPNTQQHQTLWRGGNPDTKTPNAFIPNIDNESIKEVMELDVTTQMKMLLLMGIGVFSGQSNTKYMEIMKRLCFEERLYLIIANGDFIYGMNYQMCHSFFGRDLQCMTQQKIIQAIGRIGRGNVQQEYTIRIRDDEIFRKLFLPQKRNVEAENMCGLFCSTE